MSGSETKPEVKDEEDDSNIAKKQIEIKTEVCTGSYKVIYLSVDNESKVEQRSKREVMA